MNAIEKSRIIERTDIVAEIGARVELRRRGSQWVGCCPFHADHRPSMCVTPASGSSNGFFKCFVCDAKGDVITFLRKYEGWSYLETMDYLGKKSGLSAAPAACRPVGITKREKEPSAELSEYIEPDGQLQQSREQLPYRSPLMAYLKGVLIGTGYYWRIAQIADAYGWGVDEQGADMFRYYDADGKLTKIKHQRYTSDGHRDKTNLPWVEPIPRNRATPGQPLRQCFFGEHIAATSDSSKPVVIVESEKTALICAATDETSNYIATGGESQIKALSERNWLIGRKAILAADLDDITDPSKRLWEKVARQHGWLTAQQVFPDYTEILACIGPKSDLADYYLSRFEAFQKFDETKLLRSLLKSPDGAVNMNLWNIMRHFQMYLVPEPYASR